MAGEEGATATATTEATATGEGATATTETASTTTTATTAETGKGGDGGTVLDATEVEGAKTVPATWPENWREEMAAGNEKALNVIKRFGSPQAIANALLADRQRLSSGQLKAVLPTDATPEQITAYRKDNGIPEKADGYLEKLPDGLVIGENDKPYVGEFAETMHKLNASPQLVHETLKTYYAIQAKQTEAMEERNEAARVEGTEALMAEWGPEFKGNRNAIKNMLAGLPEDARTALERSRGQDGVYLFNNPSVLRAFAQLARDLNPGASVVEASGGDVSKSITDEMSSIDRLRKEKPSEYWAENDAGKRIRARERELIDAQLRMGKKVA